MTTLAYGVWTQTDGQWNCFIYCPKCVKLDDRYTADELTGLNGDTINCCTCQTLIQDPA
jgi:hypothetical protein